MNYRVFTQMLNRETFILPLTIYRMDSYDGQNHLRQFAAIFQLFHSSKILQYSENHIQIIHCRCLSSLVLDDNLHYSEFPNVWFPTN